MYICIYIDIYIYIFLYIGCNDVWKKRQSRSEKLNKNGLKRLAKKQHDLKANGNSTYT